MLHYTVSNFRPIAGNLGVEIPLFSTNYDFVPLRAVLSLKAAGNMSIFKGYKNRERFFNYTLKEETHIIALKQVHSKFVRVAEDLNFFDGIPGERKFVPEGDGLVAAEKFFVLTVTVADCLPIWIVDKRNFFYGIVHSGWRGTGIVIEALELLRTRFGSLKENMRVVIGPGIGNCCYSVDTGRYDKFRREFNSVSVEDFHGKLYLNLQMSNVRLLKNYGIGDIVLIDDCTYCNTNLSSFRRDGRDSFGTMIAMIGWEDNFTF